MSAAQAEFEVTLVVPENLTAISNMPEKRSTSEGLDEGMIARTFETTPPMSSYLLAFIVGNITSVSGEVPAYTAPGQPSDPDARPRPVSIWGTPGKCVPLLPSHVAAYLVQFLFRCGKSKAIPCTHHHPPPPFRGLPVSLEGLPVKYVPLLHFCVTSYLVRFRFLSGGRPGWGSRAIPCTQPPPPPPPPPSPLDARGQATCQHLGHFWQVGATAALSCGHILGPILLPFQKVYSFPPPPPPPCRGTESPCLLAFIVGIITSVSSWLPACLCCSWPAICRP